MQILLYNVVKKKGVEAMKLVLKILALPVLFVVKLICVLGNLLTNVVSYVIGILLLVIPVLGRQLRADNFAFT